MICRIVHTYQRFPEPPARVSIFIHVMTLSFLPYESTLVNQGIKKYLYDYVKYVPLLLLTVKSLLCGIHDG